MVEKKLQEENEWRIIGYPVEIKNAIDRKLMEDRFSYWFHYRSIPWYRKRKIKGITPKSLLEQALKELNLGGKIRRQKASRLESYYWVIVQE